LGLRYGDDDLFVEGIYFYSDFSDKSELCSVGSPCSNGATAGSYVTGEAEISGLELQVINTFQGDNYSVPFALAYTYTKAEITGDNNASGFQDGDKLPHIPESVFSIRTGIEHASGWDNYAILKHIDSMGATTGYNRTGGSFSETDSLFVVDLISKYELAENTSVYFKVENAFDEQQIVSRAPDGARPNKPRTISTGVVVNF
jgi:Fe(3+) dicitrate transport protein